MDSETIKKIEYEKLRWETKKIEMDIFYQHDVQGALAAHIQAIERIINDEVTNG